MATGVILITIIVEMFRRRRGAVSHVEAAPLVSIPPSRVPAPELDPISTARPLRGRYAEIVIRFRYVIVIGWVLVALWAALQPHTSLQRGGAGLRDLAPVDLPAVQTELRAFEAFPVPLRSRTLLVEHDSEGIDPAQQQAIVTRVDPRSVAGSGWPDLLGGIPIVNRPLIAGSDPPFQTTAVTYLIFDPATSASQRNRQATRLARSLETSGRDVGLTGAIPARISTARTLLDSLPRLELITAAVIAVAVMVFYGSVVAPLLVLLTIGIAYLTSQAALGAFARGFEQEVPREVEPLLVALLLGVVTDYTIFYLSALRARIRDGDTNREAIADAVQRTTPIVLVAALTVAAGCGSLVFAHTDFVGAFGVPLALTVVVAATVALTFVPAMIALLGPWALWPRQKRIRATRSVSGGLTSLLMRRRVAVLVSIVTLAGLVAVAIPAASMRLGYDAISGLPASDPVARGEQIAQRGFAPGIVSPTVVLIEGSGLNTDLPRLARFQDALAAQPGVAGAFGPATARDLRRLAEPESTLAGLRDPLGLAITTTGDTARLQLVLDDDPYGGRGAETLDKLRQRAPDLAVESGLGDARLSFGGDTAVVLELVDDLRADMLRVALGVVILNLLLLSAYLRSAIAPLVVVGGSVLAVAASLGIVTFVFQDLLGYDGIAFYVPLASIVLLLSLGADYGVFSIGHSWSLARTRSLEDALIVGSRQTSGVIAMAGTILAASFALLAIVPIDAFLQFATTMAIGVLIDTFIVRPILLPAALCAIGRAALWPMRPDTSRASNGVTLG